MNQAHILRSWYENHLRQGGYVTASYVGWDDLLHCPLDDIRLLLERFASLPMGDVMEFSDTSKSVTDNSMNHRNVLEDGSKLYYLVDQIQYLDLIFNTQLIHEPWYNRYRVHPGSGRLQALWVCGHDEIKTIYTHFDEKEFVAPPYSILLNNYTEFENAILTNNEFSRVVPIDYTVYQAFPTVREYIHETKSADSEWHFENIKTDKDWYFIRYSEGNNFLQYKSDWRSFALELWHILQSGTIKLGETEFEFDKYNKCKRIVRKDIIVFEKD